jgi:hypothetical protein
MIRNMIASIELLVEQVEGRLFGPEYQAIDGKEILKCWQRIELDIAVLREGLHQPRFDRERDACFQATLNLYTKYYCPSAYYEYFSMENQIKYLLYRSEINEIIRRNKIQEYSDDIPIKPEND